MRDVRDKRYAQLQKKDNIQLTQEEIVQGFPFKLSSLPFGRLCSVATKAHLA